MSHSYNRKLPGKLGEIWISVNQDWSGDAKILYYDGDTPTSGKPTAIAIIDGDRLLIGHVVNLSALPLFAWCAAVSLAVETVMQNRAIEAAENLYLSNKTRPR